MGTHLEAYETVLRRAGKPLHVKEMVEIARSVGLLQTEGRTPVASARSLIHVEMRKNGSRSTFVKAGPAVFGLRSQMQGTAVQQERRGRARAAAGSGSGKGTAVQQERRRGRARAAAGSGSGKSKVTAGRSGAAGRYRVTSELVLRGYEVNMEGADGAAHILARRDGSMLSIRVMAMSRHPGGAYIGTIREGIVGRSGDRDMLYTFLLWESRGNDDDFVTLPFSTIDALIDRGIITRNKAGYQVRLAATNAGATINGTDVSDCLNNWDLDHLVRRPPA